MGLKFTEEYLTTAIELWPCSVRRFLFELITLKPLFGWVRFNSSGSIITELLVLGCDSTVGDLVNKATLSLVGR